MSTVKKLIQMLFLHVRQSLKRFLGECTCDGGLHNRMSDGVGCRRGRESDRLTKLLPVPHISNCTKTQD